MPSLFPAPHVAIDRGRTLPGKNLLSDSSSPELLGTISGSLAGRVGIIEISPFSFSETRSTDYPNLIKIFQESISPEQICDFSNLSNERDELQKIANYWFHGGYPEPWLNDIQGFREVWREKYLKTYIERDVAKLFPHLNSVRFRRFIELLANYSGTIINYSNIAKILDVSQPTVKDYFKIAHGTFIWRTIPGLYKECNKTRNKASSEIFSRYRAIYTIFYRFPRINDY